MVVPHDHDLADREVIGLADLPDSHQLIQFSRGTGLRRQVEAAFHRAGVQPGQHFEVGQIYDMIRLAARGVDVTVVPRSSIEGPGAVLRDLPDGARVLRLSDEAAVHHVSVVYDGKRLAPAAALLDVIERHPHDQSA